MYKCLSATYFWLSPNVTAWKTRQHSAAQKGPALQPSQRRVGHVDASLHLLCVIASCDCALTCLPTPAHTDMVCPCRQQFPVHQFRPALLAV